MLNFGLLLQAALLIAGVIWCKAVIGRMSEDMELVREKGVETLRKATVVGVWCVTAVIALLMALYVMGVIIRAVAAFR